MFEIAFTNRTEKVFLVTLTRTEKGVYAIIGKDDAKAYRIPTVYTFDKNLQTAEDVFTNPKEEIASLEDGLYVATAISDNGIHYKLKLYPEFTVEPITAYEFIDYSLDLWPDYADLIFHKYRYSLDNISSAKTILDCEFITWCPYGQCGKYYAIYNDSDGEDAFAEVIMTFHTFNEFTLSKHSVHNNTPIVTLHDSMTFTDLVCACASVSSDKKIFGTELKNYMKPNSILLNMYRKHKKKSSMDIVTQIRGIEPLSNLLRVLQESDLAGDNGEVSSKIRIVRYDINLGKSIEGNPRVITAYDVRFTDDIYQYLIDTTESNTESRIRGILKIMNQINYVRSNMNIDIEKYLEY